MASSRNSGGFAADIYKTCASQSNKNVILSPYSIESVLSLACQGAKAGTFDVLRKGLHSTGSHDKIANEFCDQMAIVSKSIGDASLIVASKAFVQRDYPVRESFRDMATEYGAEVDTVDFDKKKRTASTINTWVKQKTNNKIERLVDADSFSGETSMVLVNAIYFKATWAKQFNFHFTAYDDFWDSKTVSKKIEFMTGTNMYRYGDFPRYKCSALALKFEESAFAFLILLPDERDGLPQLENHLKRINLNKFYQKLKPDVFTVKIPKMKITSSYNLKTALSEMGMGNIFVKGKADFSGIFHSAEPVWVEDVIHMAFIEVNEMGVEAGAATAQRLAGGGPPPMVFKADRPFLYAILDDASNKIAFMGKFVGK